MRTLKFTFLFICVLLTQQLRAQMFTAPFQAIPYQKVISNGLNFDGTNDFVNITRPVTDDFTIEFWVKTSQTPASGTQWYNGSLIIDGEVSGVTNDFGIGLNGTKLAFGIGNPDYSIISSAVINDGTWKHVAVTRKKSTGAINIYINGVSDASGTASNVNSLTAPSILKMGGPNNIGSFFNGTLDDIRFWNYVRTPQQISGSMNNEMLGSETGLVAYYNFNQGTPNVSNAGVTTLLNETSSLSTYNGTLTNFSLSGGTSNWVVGKLEPLIPTNNLKLYVDAGRPRSYAGSGSVMTDLSPSGNNMTLYNSPTFYSDYGGNLNFNGTNTFLTSVSNSPLTGASPRTVCIWYNPSTITNISGSLFWTGNETVANSSFGIGFSGGKYQFWGQTNDVTDATLAPTTNTWNFIAAAYGGGTSVYQYLNGIGNLNSITNALTTPAGAFVFSKLGGPGFTGKLGNIMIFDRMLTKTDLDKLYFNVKSRIPDGLTPQTAAISGLQLHYDYPSYTSGWYWIKSSIMPNALQMYVDMTEDGGGYDFYPITTGPSVTYITETNGGTPLGLDIVYPRSKYHWRAMSNAVNVMIAANKAGGGSYGSFFTTAYGVTRSTNTGNAGSNNYSYKAMRSSDYGGSSNAPDWNVKDNGGWWLRDDITYTEPNGDYTLNAFLSNGMPNPYNLENINFNDGNAMYSTGNFYLVSTNAKKIAPDGKTIATAATSAKAIKTAYPSSTDGIYYINLPTVGIQPVYCLMDSKYDGGGWMMAMKATRGATFNYDANYWYTANTLNPTQTNQNDGDAKFDVFNYFGTTDMMALWPDIPNVGAESGSIDNLTTWSWLQKGISGAPFTLINKFASSPTQQAIYTSTNGTMTFSGFGSPFSNQPGFTFYGFNYSYSANERVRWGFAWNNETDQNSNDVRGGIGLKYVSYSAGDHIGCCQNQSGINRTARVEMYVR
jgi:hypothetical protein